MEKIPTAEEFFIEKVTKHELFNDTLESTSHALTNMMIEFAKLHVEEALKDAARNVVCYNYSVDEHSILKSYPLDKIK